MQHTEKPYATHLEKLTDLEQYVGKELGLTQWYEMTQSKIDLFAEVTEDFQWIHLDAERAARESPYKKTIAHGFLVLSMASKITFDTFSIANISMGINYGLDKVRFPNATPSGSFSSGRVSLMEYDTIPSGAKYKVSVVFELKGQEKPACVAEFLAIAYN